MEYIPARLRLDIEYEQSTKENANICVSLNVFKDAYNIACHLESFMWRSSLALPSADQFKQTILTLLGGLKLLKLEIVLGESEALPSTERVRRCLESMWKHGYTFTMENLFEIFNAVLLGNNNNSGNGVVKLLKEGSYRLQT